ncbi:WecB/TagA/CpsF family glycosyltransferase [Nonomuraea sp. JJY05]|uniref:WecB/TagA/CpsF family glycosyltransferase n=1 Tax=Nonomuraea sp. JJY05 TaxID=3350255 RepID=UPI00373FA8B5
MTRSETTTPHVPLQRLPEAPHQDATPTRLDGPPGDPPLPAAPPLDGPPPAAPPEGRAGERAAQAGGRRMAASSQARAVVRATGGDGVVAPGRWWERVRVGGIGLDALTEDEVVRWVEAELESGRGGRIVTPNVDICRAAATDFALRELVRTAELVVTDGMPLVWASRLLGTPVPERVTGADLIWSLSKLAARRGWPVYLLGGPPGVARRAAKELTSCHPRLQVCGVHAPPYHFDTTPEGSARVRRMVAAARPRVVFVGLGFPRQDRLIADLREELPEAWFVGCGAAIAFAAGTVSRAPEWMRRAGLEWAYRLGCEPGRLARRYLVDDLPFAVRLLGSSLVTRLMR